MRSSCVRVAALVLAAQVLSGAVQVQRIVGAAGWSDGATTGIPRGSIFTVLGLELAGSEAHAAQSPPPTVLNGVRVRIRAGADVHDAPLLYVSPRQINAILPEAVVEGAHSVSVEANGGESGPHPVTVTGGRFTAFTQNGQGFGPAALQNFDPSGGVSLNQFTRPARPGQAVSLWGAGLGGAREADVTVFVAGAAVRPLYAGPAPGLPGVDQINFAIPAGVAERCFVPLLVRTAGRDGNSVTLAVAATEPSCKSEFGLGVPALETLDRGGVVRGAVLRFLSDTGTQLRQSVEAWIGEYDAANLSLLAAPDPVPEAVGEGACATRGYSIAPRSSPPAEGPAGVYGLRRPFPPFLVSIRGAAGCSWPQGSVVDNVYRGSGEAACPAATYLFQAGVGAGQMFTASGPLPAPRPPDVIAQFRVLRVGSEVTASWEASSLPGDRALLTARSRHVLSGNIFGGLTNVREIACRASIPDGVFRFPGEEVEWALGLPDPDPVSLNLATTEGIAAGLDAARPTPDALDFVSVRIRNGVTVSAGLTPGMY